MPIYEYQCQQCQHRLEKLQKISDPPLATCPACGEDTLKKLVSAAAFRLKGGGWYETDFKKDGKRNLAGDSAKESDSSGKKDSSADSKPVKDSAAGKAESKPASGASGSSASSKSNSD